MRLLCNIWVSLVLKVCFWGWKFTTLQLHARYPHYSFEWHIIMHIHVETFESNQFTTTQCNLLWPSNAYNIWTCSLLENVNIWTFCNSSMWGLHVTYYSFPMPAIWTADTHSSVFTPTNDICICISLSKSICISPSKSICISLSQNISIPLFRS